MANSIITKTAKTKMAKARAGIAPLPRIVGMAFGSGGVNASGEVITPSLDATTLKKELLRKEVESVTGVTGDTIAYRYLCTLKAADLPNIKISEIGLYDNDGDIVAIRTFAAKEKDPDIDMQFEIDDKF